MGSLSRHIRNLAFPLETEAIEALDQRLLAKHHILLEDLSPDLLEDQSKLLSGAASRSS